MAGRIRTLKPEWLDDERLGAVSDAARLLSVSLILLADDWGNGRASEPFLVGRVWGYSSDGRAAFERCSCAVRELAEVEFIQLYEHRGQAYFHIRKWFDHQKVDKPGRPHCPVPTWAVADLPKRWRTAWQNVVKQYGVEPFDPDPPPDPPNGARTAHEPRTTDPDQYPDHDLRPGPTRASPRAGFDEPPPEPPSPPAPDPGGGEVVPFRRKTRVPTDLGDAQLVFRGILDRAWLEVRACPLTGEDQAVRDSATWVWQVVKADPIRFVELAQALVDRWAKDPWVRENQVRNPAANFRSQLQRLFDEHEAEHDPKARADAAYETRWRELTERIDATSDFDERDRLEAEREALRKSRWGDWTPPESRSNA